MDNKNKMPSLSLADCNSEKTAQNEAVNNANEQQAEKSRVNETAPEQTPYFVNMGEVAYVSGPSYVSAKKKHTKRNVFLIIILLIIVAFAGSYIFLPSFKNSVNSRILTPKAYFEWALGNTVDKAIKSNKTMTEDFDGVTVVLSGKDLTVTVYNDDDNMMLDYADEKNQIKAYIDKERSLKYFSIPKKGDTWYCLDDRYYSGMLSNHDFDFNAYLDDGDLNGIAGDILKSFIKNSTHLQKETNSAINIHGRFYDATKISYTMSGKQFLKFVSDTCFTLAKNEDALEFLNASSGITKDDILKIANDTNMAQQGLTGEIDFEVTFNWYVNGSGIISGFEMSVSEGGKAVKYSVLYGNDENNADFSFYVENDNERVLKLDVNAELIGGKASGNASAVFDGKQITAEFTGLEAVEGDIVSGLNGELEVDGKKIVLSYENAKQTVLVGERELSFEIFRNDSEFTSPVKDGAKYIYSDLDLLALFS